MDDTPTGLKKPRNNTDPWLVKTLTDLGKTMEFNTERIGNIRNDTKEISDWVKEHDVRHRSIDAKLALVAFGAPIIAGFILFVVQHYLGG